MEPFHSPMPDAYTTQIPYNHLYIHYRSRDYASQENGTGKLSMQLSATSAERALTMGVELLGRRAGVQGLSVHGARHYAATFEARTLPTMVRRE